MKAEYLAEKSELHSLVKGSKRRYLTLHLELKNRNKYFFYQLFLKSIWLGQLQELWQPFQLKEMMK